MWWFLNERTVFQEQILIDIFWKQCSFNILFPGRFCAVPRVCAKAGALSLLCPREAAIQHVLPLGEKDYLIKKNTLKE